MGNAAPRETSTVPTIKRIAEKYERPRFWEFGCLIIPDIPATKASSRTTSSESKSVLRKAVLAPLPPSIASRVSIVADVPETAAHSTS